MSFERYYPPFRTDFVGAAYAVNLIWELDPVVKRGFFTTTRNGYRFGQTIKTASKPGANHWERGSTEYTKDGLLQTIHALRFRRPFDAYGHRFSPADRVLFVPDYTGKIFMIYAYNHRNFEDTRAGKNVPSDQSAYFIYLYLTGMNESHWPAAKLEPYIRRATFLSNPGEIDRFIGAGAQYRVKALG